MGSISMDKPGAPKSSILKAWMPYVMIGLLLVLTRVRSLPIYEWVKSADFTHS